MFNNIEKYNKTCMCAVKTCLFSAFYFILITHFIACGSNDGVGGMPSYINKYDRQFYIFCIFFNGTSSLYLEAMHIYAAQKKRLRSEKNR